MMEKLKPHWKKFLFIASSSIVIIAIYGLVHLPESDMASIQTPEPTPPDPTGPTPTPSGVMTPEPVKNPPEFEKQVLIVGISDYLASCGYTDIFKGDDFSCWERPVMLYQLLGGNDIRIHYDEDNFNKPRVWVSVSLESFDAQKRNFTGRVAIDPCGYPGALGSTISETDERYYKEIDDTFETVDAYVEFLSKKGIEVKKHYERK